MEYNDSCESLENDSSPALLYEIFDTGDIIYYIYYYSIFFILTVVNLAGNGLIIFSVVLHRHMHVPNNYFILSLACSDILLGFFYPVYNVSHMQVPGILNTLGIWGLCTFILIMVLAVISISAFNLVAITIVRYISIRDPLKFSSRVTRKKSLIAIAAIWMTSLVFTCSLYVKFIQPCYYKKICRYELILDNRHIASFFVLTGIVPLIVMGVVYIRMMRIARKHVQVVPAVRNVGESQRVINKELKMFRMAGFLVGYFAISWIPFIVFAFVSIACGQSCNINRYIRATTRLLLHSNSAVNVIVYAGRMKDFRQVFRRDMRCFGFMKNQEQHSTIGDSKIPGSGVPEMPPSETPRIVTSIM